MFRITAIPVIIMTLILFLPKQITTAFLSSNHHHHHLSSVRSKNGFLKMTDDSPSSPTTTIDSILTTDTAPSWNTLQTKVLNTPTGKRFQKESKLRSIGQGPPHTDALIRLFDSADESEIRVTLYRDDAAWCPYCQKTWLLLEEKRIPYRVSKVPMNAYGDKPAWFTRKVDGGKLPAMEMDGELYLESLHIMKVLDDTFPNFGPKMIPSEGTPDAKVMRVLLDLERELQRDWFSLTFYPVEGEALLSAKSNLLDTLQKVNDALGDTSGVWFLGGDSPSLVDLQYISHVERIIASVFYWKGTFLRGTFDNIDRWLEAFEERPSYQATKSDYYTHVMVMPSQNGPGYFVEDARDISANISGLDEAWELPLLDHHHKPLLPLIREKEARHEAAFKLITNHQAVVKFASRGAGEPGKPSYHAELADPYAEPNEVFNVPVDICLRHVTAALLDGVDDAVVIDSARIDLAGRGGSGELRSDWESYEDDYGRTYFWNYETGDVMYTPPTRQLDTCLAYLRDRVGVPRDMGEEAAMQLRAYLNWGITQLK